MVRETFYESVKLVSEKFYPRVFRNAEGFPFGEYLKGSLRILVKVWKIILECTFREQGRFLGGKISRGRLRGDCEYYHLFVWVLNMAHGCQ